MTIREKCYIEGIACGAITGYVRTSNGNAAINRYDEEVAMAIDAWLPDLARPSFRRIADDHYTLVYPAFTLNIRVKPQGVVDVWVD